MILFFVLHVLPAVGGAILSALYALAPIIIMLIGGIILLGAVGIKVSNNLGSTVFKGIFGLFGFILQQAVRIAGMLFFAIVNFLPIVFFSSRKMLVDRFHIKRSISSVLSFLVALLVLGIII